MSNEAGIDSVGLHVPARALVDLGDVVVIAAGREFSRSRRGPRGTGDHPARGQAVHAGPPRRGDGRTGCPRCASRPDRSRAFTEAIKAVRPHGVVVAIGISRYASLINGLKNHLLNDAVFRSIVERDLLDGQHHNPEVHARPEFFTTAYVHLPDELREEAVADSLHDVRLFAVEGPAWILEDIDDINNQLFAARATESEPALLAATSHIMVTGAVPHDLSWRPLGEHVRKPARSGSTGCRG